FVGANNSASHTSEHTASSTASADWSLGALDDRATATALISVLEVLQSVVEPQSGKNQKQRSGSNPASQKWTRESLDLRDQLPLFTGHMLLRPIKKDLIIFMTGKQTPPDQQQHEYDGNDSPGYQNIQDGTCESFHGNLPLDPLRGPNGECMRKV